MELEEAADELYAVVPGEFVAVRKRLADRARDDGDRGLATEIGGLPKPTTAGWVCNVLVRHHREEIEGLLELGGLLREAQSSLAGDQLRALNSQRGRLLSALTRQASALARDLGHPVSGAVAGQVEDTLRAALADPAAGGALLSGRLTAPLSYSGGLDAGAAVARPDLQLVRPKPAPARGAAPRQGEEERRHRELDAARTAAAEAAAAAREATAAAHAERERADELAAHRDERQARMDALSEELAGLRGELEQAEAELARAQRRARTAERRAQEAESAEEHARARLAEFER